MSKRRDQMIMQLEIQNSVPNLKELEDLYLPMFKTARNRKAVLALLKLVHTQCTISPFDSTITYPNGQTSISSIGDLLKFFVCGEKVSEMPPDAPTFLSFLKARHFVTDNLCMVKMDK